MLRQIVYEAITDRYFSPYFRLYAFCRHYASAAASRFITAISPVRQSLFFLRARCHPPSLRSFRREFGCCCHEIRHSALFSMMVKAGDSAIFLFHVHMLPAQPPRRHA